MVDNCENDNFGNNYQQTCLGKPNGDLSEPTMNYSNVKYQIDLTNSVSLPTSPSKDNIDTINVSGSSLSNSLDNISHNPMVSELEFLTANDDSTSDVSMKPQSSFHSNLFLTNQKRKKSNLFSSANNYRNKVDTFTKTFAETEAMNDTLLSDFSCALVKNSHSILQQGRLYVTERWICFYSKIMSFENKIVLPVSSIANVSKEKTARVIPNAIQITTETGKYFFTSFGSRDKTFNIISDLWQNFKDKKTLSNTEEKCIIQNFYGNEVDLLINDETTMEHLQNAGKPTYDKEVSIPSFVVGDESDTDTDPFLNSSNFNQTDEIIEKSPKIRFRKKNHQVRVTKDQKLEEEYHIAEPTLLHSFNSSNNTAKPLTRVFSHPNLGKRMHSQSCVDHEHYQKFYLDEEIEMHVDRLFNCLFTNSSFFKRFCEYRKTFDIVQSPWPDEYNSDSLKERVIYYTLTLKAKIGPKISASEEKQIVHNNSQPGLFYMVDTEIRNSGFPLSDCFHSVNRYCLVHVGGSKSRLRVSSQIIYDKSLFFASKSLIESTAKSGIMDYFNELENALKHEARSPVHQMNVNHGPSPAPIISDMTRASMFHSQDKQRKANIPIIDSHHSSFPDNFNPSPVVVMRADRAWFLLIVLSLILCLCLSFLFSRFRQLEEITNNQLNRQYQSKFEPSFDLKEIIQNQQQRQLDELSQWKILVDNSIDLIDQMRKVLVIIKSNLDKLSQEIKSHPVQFGDAPRATKSHDGH